MIIAATSDLHGYLPIWDNIHCDVLCVCGDIMPLDIQDNILESRKWLKEAFVSWTDQIDCKIVLLVAGNHDLVFERTLSEDIYKIFLNTKIKYLENELIEYENITFYGTPYCKEFGNWAFMRTDERLKLIYDTIPQEVTVLLTHDAPYGVNDICLEDVRWNKKEHIGNIPLAKAIRERNIKYNIHGHLHSTLRDWELLEDTLVRNVSAVNEKYQLVAEPFIFEI